MKQGNWALVAYFRGYYGLDRLYDAQIRDLSRHCKASIGGRLPKPHEATNKRLMGRLLKEPVSQDAETNKADARALALACDKVLTERGV